MSVGGVSNSKIKGDHDLFSQLDKNNDGQLSCSGRQPELRRDVADKLTSDPHGRIFRSEFERVVTPSARPAFARWKAESDALVEAEEHAKRPKWIGLITGTVAVLGALAAAAGIMAVFVLAAPLTPLVGVFAFVFSIAAGGSMGFFASGFLAEVIASIAWKNSDERAERQAALQQAAEEEQTARQDLLRQIAPAPTVQDALRAPSDSTR